MLGRVHARAVSSERTTDAGLAPRLREGHALPWEQAMAMEFFHLGANGEDPKDLAKSAVTTRLKAMRCSRLGCTGDSSGHGRGTQGHDWYCFTFERGHGDWEHFTISRLTRHDADDPHISTGESMGGEDGGLGRREVGSWVECMREANLVRDDLLSRTESEIELYCNGEHALVHLFIHPSPSILYQLQ